MPRNECIPYYEPGSRLSGDCTDDVVGKTFVQVSQAIPGGIAGTGNIQIEPADLGAPAVGVASYDAAEGEVIPLLNGPGMVVPVTAGVPLSAGQEVMVGPSSEAVPYDAGGAVAASLRTGVVAANNAITWTAVHKGLEGNAIGVTLVDPRGTGRVLSVDVDGQDVIVSLATDGGGAITSTPATIIAAVLEHDTASQLVIGTNTGASTGAAAVAAVARTALAGGTDPIRSGQRPVGLALDDALAGADCPVRLYT